MIEQKRQRGLLREVGYVVKNMWYISVDPNYDKYVDPEFYHNLALLNGGKAIRKTLGEVLSTHLPSTTEGHQSKVLDIAAGTGLAASKLFELGYSVEAMDYSKKALAFLQQSLPDIKTRRGDMNERFPYEDASFDGVVTLWANRFIEKPDHFAREVSRVLKPNGVFVWPISIPEGMDWKMASGYNTPTSAKKLKGVLESAGFSEVEIVKIPLYRNLRYPFSAYPTRYLVARKASL